MRASVKTLALCSLVAAFMAVVGQVAIVHAEPLCGPGMPRSIDRAGGLAFIATVRSASFSHESERWIYDFEIEEVVVPNPALVGQGFLAGQTAHVLTSPCGPIKNLQVGQQYLITTYPGFSGFPSTVTFVWKVMGDRVALVWMYGGKVWDYTEERGSFLTHVDKSVTSVRTLTDAIYLITHGSLTETDAADRAPEGYEELPWPMLIAVPAIWLAVLGLRRRQADLVRGAA